MKILTAAEMRAADEPTRKAAGLTTALTDLTATEMLAEFNASRVGVHHG